MRIGIDIGGTFTDVVALDAVGRILLAKTFSTPEDPSVGVLEGLSQIARQTDTALDRLLAGTSLFIHGTTVATNILVERKGARLGLITSKGFRDLLELREGTKANRYDLRSPPPLPLILRRDRREVPERVRWDGTVETPLDEGATIAELRRLQEVGVGALVVCFLHAHRFPNHERRVRELIDVIGWSPFVSLSHEVLNREGEYHRLSTAAVNAYVGPGLKTYLERVGSRLAETGLRVPMLVMQSSGGVLPIDRAVSYAVGSIASGPVGGAMAGVLIARSAGLARVVTYDMGGTSTDVSVILDGAPVEREKLEIDNVKIASPAIDIIALGAGGGSIARLDHGGVLELGPESAGARPGPVCYGGGGERPTLTDANLVLGYISDRTFLGGRLHLSIEKARSAIAKTIAEPLSVSVEEASLAIHALGTSRIAEGVRMATLQRGHDPRGFTLCAFGGAGGLHAEAVARDLSIPNVVIPPQASVLSALGLLATDIRHDYLRPIGKPITNLAMSELREAVAGIEAEGRQQLSDEGFGSRDVAVVRVADCRFLRQISTLAVPIDDADLAENDTEWLARRFEERYRARYFHIHERGMSVVDQLRIAVIGRNPRIQLTVNDHHAADPSPARRGQRLIFFDRWWEAAVYWFADLRHGMRLTGPAVVDSDFTSILVPMGSCAEVDRFGNLTIAPRRGP